MTTLPSAAWEVGTTTGVVPAGALVAAGDPTVITVVAPDGCEVEAGSAATFVFPAAFPAAFEVEEAFAGEVDEATGADEAAAEATGAADEAAGEEAPTPHCPIGLLPGRADMVPKMVSWIGLTMLQVVEGSLRPPIRPGHLSIPASPALQLSMICWRVVTSQPESCYSLDVNFETIWESTYEVSVEPVTSWVTVRKDERLSSLTRCPSASKFGGVPVHLVEEMRRVDPT